jgi:hypothetical protein
VTGYKQHSRIRIQILTHALPRAVAEAVENHLAAAAGLRIVSRADAHTGAPLTSPSPVLPEPSARQVREPRRLS